MPAALVMEMDRYVQARRCRGVAAAKGALRLC
jgi:hypothetical protein